MPRDPLKHTENLLRDLVGSLLRSRDGDDWLNKAGIASGALRKWGDRLAKEPLKRPGGEVDTRLLFYSDFSELRDIIERNWEAGFGDVFANKDQFLADIKRLLAFRNPEAHARELLPFEDELVKGITGQIRQEITLFLSKSGNDGEPEHFARIEEMRDNFGNRVTGKYSGNPQPFTGNPLLLHPGESVQFTGRAWDPEGEEVDWYLGRTGEHIGKGLELDWTWDVSQDDIADPQQLVFLIRPTVRAYSRTQAKYDDATTFVYRVLPGARAGN